MSADREGPAQKAPASRDPGAGLLLGRPFGIPVYLTPTWWIIVALITVAFAPLVDVQLDGVGAWRYAVSFAFAVLLYLSVLVHELSHSIVALRFGLPVRRITLYLLGGASEIEREPETPGREFLVAVVGPLVSILLGVVGIGGLLLVPDGTVLGVLVLELTGANLLVGAFNLLPGLPLDGGRVLRAFVWKISGRPFTGSLVAAWAGRALALLILAAPLAISLMTEHQPSVIDVVLAAFFAGFIWLGATHSLRVARVRERLPGLRLREITRPAQPVLSDLPVSEAVRRASEAGAHGLVVVDSSGQPTGIVSEAAVMATPERRRPWVEIGTLSRSLEPGLVLSSDLSGERLVDAIRTTPATEYLVVEPSGEIFGILAAVDVERAFARS